MTLTFLTNSSYTSFLITFVSTTTLNFFKSVSNLSASNLSTLLFKLIKPLNLLASNSSTVVLKLAKSASSSIFYVSTLVALFKSDFVA